MAKVSRREITALLTQYAVQYLANKKFSVHREVAVLPWGKRRADVLALNMRGVLVIGEIKSCAADYSTDTKWQEYLQHCSKFYFFIGINLFESSMFKRMKSECRAAGAGIVLCHDGAMKVVLAAKQRTVAGVNRRALITRLAYRSGETVYNTDLYVRPRDRKQLNISGSSATATTRKRVRRRRRRR